MMDWRRLYEEEKAARIRVVTECDRLRGCETELAEERRVRDYMRHRVSEEMAAADLAESVACGCAFDFGAFISEATRAGDAALATLTAKCEALEQDGLRSMAQNWQRRLALEADASRLRTALADLEAEARKYADGETNGYAVLESMAAAALTPPPVATPGGEEAPDWVVVGLTADGQRVHSLKTWPGPFAAVRDGRKGYEIRKADRDFRVGDRLDLEEWDPATGRYTGEHVSRVVAYMTPPGEWGLPAGVCVLGLAAPDATAIRNAEREECAKVADARAAELRALAADLGRRRGLAARAGQSLAEAVIAEQIATRIRSRPPSPSSHPPPATTPQPVSVHTGCRCPTEAHGPTGCDRCPCAWSPEPTPQPEKSPLIEKLILRPADQDLYPCVKCGLVLNRHSAAPPYARDWDAPKCGGFEFQPEKSPGDLCAKCRRCQVARVAHPEAGCPEFVEPCAAKGGSK